MFPLLASFGNDFVCVFPNVFLFFCVGQQSGVQLAFETDANKARAANDG